MLAAVTSTKAVGDQLWVKIIGPASCGKSTLCEAISVNTDFVLAKSTIRGFHSGWQDGSEEDASLIAQVSGKTLVTKDGDTLLQAPNLGQILSEARDLYDSTSRSHYRNKAGKDYTGIRMTWLLCGTSSLKSIDSSELGERFLDCVIMDGIDDEMEDEVLWRVVNRADRNLSIESKGGAEEQYEPSLASAMQLTGGYVGYLRENAVDLLSQVESPEWALRKCARLGKFVAYMRARPSTTQDETSEREFAARLVSQHIRLAKCLAVVMNRTSIDEAVMKRVVKVSMDTSRGMVLDIVTHLYGAKFGIAVGGIAQLTNYGREKVGAMLRFLENIGAVEKNLAKERKTGAMTKQNLWRLTPRLSRIYTEIGETG
jgi:hypothetical protein